MDFNYTLKYRTFDQLLEDVSIDFNTFALENMIEPQQLIKLAKKINYELGLRLNQTKEILLEVHHGKVKLPDDFYTFNFAFICGEYQTVAGYDGYAGGTNIQEIPYTEFPAQTILNCCEAPRDQPCCFNGKQGVCVTHNPEQPYGDTCIPPRVVTPRVFMNCKNEAYELVQVINPSQTRVYRSMIPLRMKASQEIECNCPNLYYNTHNEGWIKHGFLFTTFQESTVYLNYQGQMEDDNGNLLVPDHDLLNEYYEYAFKQRILENLLMNGEDVSQRIQIIEARVRVARNNAMSLVNTPNFRELYDIWWTNRKAQYSKYYDMFNSNRPANTFRPNPNATRVV
jgi:hypothetical protein